MKGWFGGGKKQPEPAGFDPEEAGVGGVESEKSFDPDGDGAGAACAESFCANLQRGVGGCAHRRAARTAWLCGGSPVRERALRRRGTPLTACIW